MIRVAFASTVGVVCALQILVTVVLMAFERVVDYATSADRKYVAWVAAIDGGATTKSWTALVIQVNPAVFGFGASTRGPRLADRETPIGVTWEGHSTLLVRYSACTGADEVGVAWRELTVKPC